nr:DUF2510 domain-containing protein [Microbacterium hydrocarbonoxydans]
MTTPAGWYDDGSGRQRWWDGEQWTEHFAPAADAPVAAEASADAGAPSQNASESAASAETHDAINSVAAVEAGATWDGPSSADASAPTSTSAPTENGSAGDASDPVPPHGGPAADAAPADVWSSEPAQSADTPPSESPASDAPVPPYANTAPEPPLYAAPAYPGAAPTYPGAETAYPGGAQGYAGSPYPGAAPAYGAPGAYPVAAPSAPSGPAGLSVLGLVGLGLAALGTILACIPLGWIALIGWLMLVGGFFTSLISLFLKGRKWPGITGLIVSVVGGVLAVILSFFFAIAAVSEAIRDLPTPPPSSESDTTPAPSPSLDPDDGGSTGQIEEGTIGDTVTLRFLGGSGEVTVTEATWSTDVGTGVPSTNGGYLTIETTWTGIDGVTPANPLFTSLETADGTAGELDFFVTGAPNELLDPGQTASGPITFDVAESESYVFVITDEATREIARISITPTAG